jgi:hypothetical protein
LRQRLEIRSAALIRNRILLFQPRRDGFQRCFRLSLRDSRLQPAKHADHAHATLVEEGFERAREDLGMHADRNPQLVGIGGHHRAFEARGRHSDDRVRNQVQVDSAADRARIGAEHPRPELVADNDHRVAARGAIFFGPEGAAHYRFHSEDIEVVRRRQHGRLRSRFALSAERRPAGKIPCEPGEHVALIAEIFVIQERHGRTGQVRARHYGAVIDSVDLHHARGLFDR